MEITRYYQPREINWLLVPALLEGALNRIPAAELRDGQDELRAVLRFSLNSFSQLVTIDSGADFGEFIRTSSEQPSKVVAEISCYQVPNSISPYKINPPYLNLFWERDLSLSISLWRTTSEVALPLLQELEESLQLSPERPAERLGDESPRKLRRTAFLAHAFDDLGRSYAYQLTKFLSLLNFEVATGEGFSPESVSAKVRRRLIAQEIVIVVLSERQEHAWLIQEAAGAKFTEKPIIVLLEEGVQFKSGMLGDVEYIVFPKHKISDCFTPILEGLRELGFEFR